MSRHSRGRYRCFWASLPQRLRQLFTSVFCTSTRTPTDASTLLSSSMTRMALKKEDPAPPYASGTSMPMMSRPKSLFTRSGRISCCSSMAWRRGSISFLAKSATSSWKASSSSPSWVKGMLILGSGVCRFWGW